ncbi:MAG: hypothetical protein HPY57_13600 [Ignavibacteria bacterium]|nr:hypothetical protein [Ignavibacteria bacterium]
MNFKYLKPIKEFCDEINTELGYTDYNNRDVFPFFVFENGDIEFGADRLTHSDMKITSTSNELLRGRIFLKEKVIGFWNIENYDGDFKELFQKIQHELSKWENGINFFDGKWRIDLPINDSDVKLFNEKGYYTYYMKKTWLALVPITDFVSGEYKKYVISDEDIMRSHSDVKLRQELKKKGFGKGWGSDLTAWDSKNPLFWRQAKYQESKGYEIEYEEIKRTNECHFPELFEMKKKDLEADNLDHLISEFGGDEERAREDFNWFYNILVNLNKGGYIYRIIFLPDLKYLNKEELGSHWTHDEDKAKDLIRSLKDMIIVDIDDYDIDDYEPYLITAKIKPNNIDFEKSMGSFCKNYLEEEINVKNQKKIEIVSIKKLNLNEILKEI